MPPGSSYSSSEWYRQQEDRAVGYLGKFGYLTGPSQETGNLMSKDDFIKALKNLQRWGHIPETGVIDRRTLQLMSRPRCGVPDEDRNSLTKRRKKRYVTAPSKWEKNNLTFRILNYTPDMSIAAVRRAITEAFKVWSDVTSLTFTEVVNSDADILIQFAVEYHHDGYPFDGKGSVLAHAFFPGDDRGGDTHFDDDETWTLNSTEGVDLFMVAAHEFGHALGLAHSSNTEALMYPWYQEYQPGYKLPYDDVAGIQSLYGSKTGGFIPDPVTPRPTYRPVVTDRPGYTVNPHDRDRDRDRGVTRRPHYPDQEDKNILCTHSIDAITVIRKEVFIFIGSKFWRLGTNGIRGDPTEIHKFWYNLPDDGIDAIYERTDGKIVFFKGNRFWVFAGNHMLPNFPKEGRLITELGIGENVKKVDAVFVWGFNKRTYIITGDMYWKLNGKEDYIEYDYPRDMHIWRNIPVPVDSAFQHWDGKTYFFQGDQYWEFYDNKMRARKKSPKPIGKIFGCKNGKLKLENVKQYSAEPDKGFFRSAEEDSKASKDSGTGKVHFCVTNLILFVILYFCFH